MRMERSDGIILMSPARRVWGPPHWDIVAERMFPLRKKQENPMRIAGLIARDTDGKASRNIQIALI